MSKLILASSSPYRKALLERLNLPFRCISPEVDESPKVGEKPQDLVARLAFEKAAAVAAVYQQDWVIGSDQIAVLHNNVLNKPGNYHRAFEQLSAQSGQKVLFLTGITLLNKTANFQRDDVVSTEVDFRTLSDTEIDSYLNQDQPWNCAGSFKAEGLGISLFNSIRSTDPSALIGLPLIRLCEMLRESSYKSN